MEANKIKTLLVKCKYILFLLFFFGTALFCLDVRADTLTVYPDASTGGTTVDGDVGEQSLAGTTWPSITGAAGDQHSDTSALIRTYYQYADSGEPDFSLLYRGILLFDTSSLGSDATVSSATVSLFGQAKYNQSSSEGSGHPDSTSINVYTSTPASDNDLANADYAQIGTTAQATAIEYSSFSASGYNNFTLNATGLSNISKTGITKFGTREASYDVTGTTPPCAGFCTTEVEGYIFYSADQAGTDNDPKLVINYTPAVSNTTPTASSVTVSPKSNKVGYDFTFTGTWTESDAGDNVKMYICKDSSCTNCDNTSQTNCWCYSDDNVTQPTVTDTCTYTAQSSDIGNRNFYMKVCDDEPSCSVSIFGGSFLVGPATSTPLRFKGGVVLRIKNGFDSKSIRIRCL